VLCIVAVAVVGGMVSMEVKNKAGDRWSDDDIYVRAGICPLAPSFSFLAHKHRRRGGEGKEGMVASLDWVVL
jgi:hypothetical protein